MVTLAQETGPSSPDRPPILIVDGGLGDNRFYVTHWLGEAAVIAEEGDVRLITNAAPTWWSGESAPDTYLLTASDDNGGLPSTTFDSERIAWALDRLAERHPEGKAVLVAQGGSALACRTYLEDLGKPTQSSRADAIGLVMLGPPNAGLSYLAKYPDLDVLEPFAAAAGVTPQDLAPGSEHLARLDDGKFPNVLKVLIVEGVAVTLAEMETDGVIARQDSRLATGVAASDVDYVTVRARASESWPLEKTWLPKSKKGGATLNAVDDTEVERLGPARGYVTVPEVQDAVRTFYQTWFAGNVPTTHISTRLVLDVSGSMAEDLSGITKLDAARAAGNVFADTLAARQVLTRSVPEDIGLILFNVSPTVAVAPTTDAKQVGPALAAAVAAKNTDVGLALTAAIESFSSSPRTADKAIVFLSDGVATEGMTPDEIVAGPVARAAEQGIRIETIALGGVEQADIEFLKRLASETGGQFHEAQDQFELQRDFLRARYASLGTLDVDQELDLAATTPVEMGSADENTRLLEAGIVSEAADLSWILKRDGTSVPESEVNVETLSDGVVALAVNSPEPGAYTLEVSGSAGRAHVFAVRQVDAFITQGTAAAQSDTDILLLGGIGIAALLAVGVTVVTAVRGRKRRAAESHDTSESSFLYGDPDSNDEGGGR